MLFPTSLLILVACVAIVGRGAHTVVYFRRQKALKEKLGCQPLQNRFVFEYLHGFVLFLESYLSLRRHRFLDNSRERFKLHGATYKTNMLGENVIFTIDPENIKAVLATNFSDYSLGDRRKGALTHIFGYGIITTDAAAWSHFRKLSLRSFSQQALTNLTILDEHVSLLLKLIPGDGSTVDLRPLFFNMMLEITSKTFCGEAISCLDSEGSITAQGFSEAFDDSQRSLRNALYFGRLSLWGPFTTFRRNQEYIHRFMNGITAKATATYKSIDPDYDPLIEKPQWKPGQYGKDVFKDTKDHHIVQAALTQAFLGGRDTTSGLLTNLWFVLARRLDVWKRLQSEIAFLQGEKPTIKQLKEIEYLRWFINEGLRLFPPVPVNRRAAIKDTVLPRGGGPDGEAPILVPEGTIVDYHLYSVHRREDFYGPDATEFKPERWQSLKPAWEFLPFNAGPRGCLGQTLAYTQVGYATVRLLQEFQKIAPRDPRAWQESLTLTMSCANGTKVALWRN